MPNVSATVEVMLSFPYPEYIYLLSHILEGDLQVNMECTYEGTLFRVTKLGKLPPGERGKTFSNIVKDTGLMGRSYDFEMVGQRHFEIPTYTMLKFMMPTHRADTVPEGAKIPDAIGKPIDIERPQIEKLRDDDD